MVWSSPWTPPTGSRISGGADGGSITEGNNATNLAYASQLANYVSTMKNTYGVNLYAISIQNEPEQMSPATKRVRWTAQIHDFVTNLYNALVANGVSSTKIMLPESQNWKDHQNLATPPP